MMKKFRRRQAEAQARQWNGESPEEFMRLALEKDQLDPDDQDLVDVNRFVFDFVDVGYWWVIEPTGSAMWSPEQFADAFEPAE